MLRCQKVSRAARDLMGVLCRWGWISGDRSWSVVSPQGGINWLLACDRRGWPHGKLAYRNTLCERWRPCNRVAIPADGGRWRSHLHSAALARNVASRSWNRRCRRAEWPGGPFRSKGAGFPWFRVKEVGFWPAFFVFGPDGPRIGPEIREVGMACWRRNGGARFATAARHEERSNRAARHG